MSYRKIPKISPGAYIFQSPFFRGLFLEGLIFGEAYLRKEICVSKSIGLRSFIVGRKFTRSALFYFVLESNFPRTSPQGAYNWWGDLTEGFLFYRIGGPILEWLIFGILQHLNDKN